MAAIKNGIAGSGLKRLFVLSVDATLSLLCLAVLGDLNDRFPGLGIENVSLRRLGASFLLGVCSLYAFLTEVFLSLGVFLPLLGVSVLWAAKTSIGAFVLSACRNKFST